MTCELVLNVLNKMRMKSYNNLLGFSSDKEKNVYYVP